MSPPDPRQQSQEPAADVGALTQAAGGLADACHASDAPTAAQEALDSAALTTYWAETLGDALTDGTLDADQHLPPSRPRTDSGVTTIRDLDLLPVATVRRSQSGVASAPPAHRHAPSAAVVTGGSFDIRHMLGQGGMGIVYCAHQGSLDREVALKTLKPEAALHGGRDRFVAEARVTGALDHPNIVPVHELGRTEDGEVFLAMKMVRGAGWSALLGPKATEQIQAQWRAVAQPNGHLTALYALAPLALAKSATAVDFSVAGVPWQVQAGPLPAGATLARESTGTWRAVAPRSEAQPEPNTLWRRDVFGGEPDGGGQSRPIAVATGGVLLCERHAILHLDGSSGRVVHRLAPCTARAPLPQRPSFISSTCFWVYRWIPPTRACASGVRQRRWP